MKKIMDTKIVNNHIPRTIFGVKYDYYSNLESIIELNCLDKCDTKSQQLQVVRALKQYPTLYKNIKLLKWCIKP